MASEDTRKERLSVADQVIWWVGSVAANGSVSGAAASECRALIEGIERALHAAQSQLAETTAALGRAREEAADVERVQTWMRQPSRQVPHTIGLAGFGDQRLALCAGTTVVATAPDLPSLGAALREAEQATTKEGGR